MHVIPAFSFFAGDEACTRRSSSSSSSSSSSNSSSRTRIAAPADRSTASAVLAAGGDTARRLAEAGSCSASSSAGAEAEAIGSDLLRRPRGRATQARQSADVCLSVHRFRAHTTKYCKKVRNTEKNKTQWYDILGKVRGTKDQPIDQRTNDKMFGP